MAKLTQADINASVVRTMERRAKTIGNYSKEVRNGVLVYSTTGKPVLGAPSTQSNSSDNGR
jgi:hypothetical protein